MEGDELAVVQLSYTLNGDELIAQYLLGTEEEFCVPPLYNQKQAGLSLPGVVLSASGQTAKLHLDIDERQDEEGAYSFSYAPQTNNGMYSMPQVGAKAVLRWNSAVDGDAMIVHSIHTGGAFGDYLNRSFTTEFGKQMAMFPSLLSFAGDGNSLALNDSGGVTVKTGHKLVLRSQGLLSIRSKKKLIFKTPEQLKMLKPGKKVSGIDVRGGQMHMKSLRVVVCGDPSKKKLPAKPPIVSNVKSVNLAVLQAANGMLPMTGKTK